MRRTFGWLGNSRRLSKDYERKVQTSEALIEVAMIRLMLRRLAGSQLGSSPQIILYESGSTTRSFGTA